MTGTRFAHAPSSSAEILERASRILANLASADGPAPRLVFVNGRVAPSLCDPRRLPEGVELSSLGEALARGDDADLTLRPRHARGRSGPRPRRPQHRPVRGRGAAPACGAARALGNRCTWCSSPWADRRRPRSTPASSTGWRTTPRSPSSSAWCGEVESPWLSNAVVEAWLGDRAALDLLEVQEQPREALHFRSLRVHQAGDSRFASACLSIGAALARNDVHVRLAGQRRRVPPRRPDPRAGEPARRPSDEHRPRRAPRHQPPALQGHPRRPGDGSSSAGACSSEPHAQKTDARQANHNLLLSPDAVANASRSSRSSPTT